MSYKILLFDLDDTLLDFAANEAESLRRLFQRRGILFSDELHRTYHLVNKQLWTDYENGKRTLNEVLNARFPQTLAKLGHDLDGIDWENEYRELLGQGCQLVDGAGEVCRNLAISHRLFVITNGVTQTQLKRLRQSGLFDCFEGVFTSQSIGYQKPSVEFFAHVMNHIAGFHAEEALVIGDSLNTDIKGGLFAGLDTCWLNRKALEAPAEIQSTYTIASLTELYKICGVRK